MEKRNEIRVARFRWGVGAGVASCVEMKKMLNKEMPE